MSFDFNIVDKIWRLVANNWYLVLINDQARGFFHSTRGVEQGDPLSSTLFILAAEVLSRALNSLFYDPGYKGYRMPKWNENINHLAYIDGTIIFTSIEKFSLQMIMGILKEYESQLGQLIIKEKRFFFV